jgi:cold shock CspA family protein
MTIEVSASSPPAIGGKELFVHINAMPRDGNEPAVGEWLSYELGRDRNGRVQAVNVLRGALSPSLASSARRRTWCSQMTSCAEATYFLNHCPDTRMDGDHDGIPCEDQWCTAGSSR